MTNLHLAPDNVDRMLFQVLEETFDAEPWRKTTPLVVVNDATGALSEWTQSQGLNARFVQDSAALAAQHADVTGPVATFPHAEVLSGATTVVYRMARPLEALEEFSWQVARWADPNVMLLGGQLQRHLNFSMNTTLEANFARVSASRGYYKARALRAESPKALVGTAPPRMPRINTVRVADVDLELRAYGLTFGAARLDPGTALLLETIGKTRPELFRPDTVAVDLGCGNGTIAATLAKKFNCDGVTATDDSASAVRSTRATLAANAIDNVQVVQQSGLEQLSAESLDVVVLNPPFHDGTELTSDIAHFLFGEASRTLKPGGVLLTVFNSSRRYGAQLVERVGPTEQLARDTRFIVTESQKV